MAAVRLAADSLEAIVFFDGVCNLCNGAVQFILQREKNPRLKFAALQGETFRARTQHHLTAVPDSIIFLEAGILYTESDAVLRISRYLRQPWRAMGFMGYAIPRFLRNPLYRFIARNRYRWFGKKEACYVPSPALRARFLD
jgi:predicted DCC family thiol-disulfide oxidoreductase YuxK